jgi:PadR family transcriptional regulator PadR
MRLPGPHPTHGGPPTFRRIGSSNIINRVKNMGRSDPAHLGDFEQLVLLALVRLGPEAYGASIRREIERCTGRDLAMSAVYVAVDRLEAKGLVRTRVGAPLAERGGRRRRHVALLSAGRTAIAAAHRQFKAMTEGLDHRLEPS